MIFRFSTKRDGNGNRYFLGIDTEKRIFSRESAHWYGKEDVIEIKKSDRQKMIDDLRAAGYSEINYI